MKLLTCIATLVSLTTIVFAEPAGGEEARVAQTTLSAEKARAPFAKAKALNSQMRFDKDCVDMQMSCNSTVTGVLDETDCVIEVDNSRIDFWVFQGTAGMEVTINLSSDEFDTWAFLFTPLPAGLVFASNDDIGPGNTNSRIQATLDETGEWAIGANGFDATQLGNYTLQLECDGADPVVEIPTLSTLGLALLALGLFGLAVSTIRRQSRDQTS